MTKPVLRFPKVLAAVLVVLGLSLGTGEGQSLLRLRLARFGTRPVRTPHVQRPLAPRRRPIYAPDRVLVRFRPGTTALYADALLRSYGFPEVRPIAAIGVYCVKTPAGNSVSETLALLRRNGDVELAHPDYRARLTDVPNDPFFQAYQYALRNRGGLLDLGPGFEVPMTAGADIKATTAWDVNKGDPGIVIAVVDSGVDMTHVDLAGKFVSTGYDFANGDSDATDDVWHGTQVAGIAAANTNNSIGVAGVARDCRILPVKVTDATGDGFYSWIIDGIVWAADQGADVINLSLGGDFDDPFLEDACRYAHDKGTVVVASAGNSGAAGVLYPAAYDAYVLAVAASDYNDEITLFSTFGPEVDVAAPGDLILGPVPQWYADAAYGPGSLPYQFAGGTSFSAPHVAGMAALIKCAKPGLAVDDIMKLIRYTADDVNRSAYPGRDDHAGYGRINMTRALAPTILQARPAR